MADEEQHIKVEASGPSMAELLRRIAAFVFGILQTLIILRIVLFLLDARVTNGLVSRILNASGSVLDVAAIVALVGWTILEGLVIAGLAIFRREPA